jgi:hypothetical protein
MAIKDIILEGCFNYPILIAGISLILIRSGFTTSSACDRINLTNSNNNQALIDKSQIEVDIATKGQTAINLYAFGFALTMGDIFLFGRRTTE